MQRGQIRVKEDSIVKTKQKEVPVAVKRVPIINDFCPRNLRVLYYRALLRLDPQFQKKLIFTGRSFYWKKRRK